jgi:hypothetical protein
MSEPTVKVEAASGDEGRAPDAGPAAVPADTGEPAPPPPPRRPRVTDPQHWLDLCA